MEPNQKRIMDRQVYQRAESFLPWNLQHHVLNSTIFPYWTHDALYYFQSSKTGRQLIRVDLQDGKKEPILDFQDLIKALALEVKEKFDTESLPLDRFLVQENPQRICFPWQKKNWVYDLAKKSFVEITEIKPDYLPSPDGNWALQVRNHNLFLIDMLHHQDFQLTNDGMAYHDYASSPETNTHAVTQRLNGEISSPIAIWSPDFRKIITHKLDQRKVKSLHLLQNAPTDDQRPKLHTYRMSFSGDDDLPLAELMLINVAAKTITPIKAEPLLSPYLTAIEFKWVWWSEDAKKIYFLRETRGARELILCCADAGSGETEILVTETNETFVEPSTLAPWPHQIIILENKKIIWLSQSSGYPHLYLCQPGGKTAITQGEWCVREVHFYDDKNDWLYFTACGRDKNLDPYFKQLFRCRLNGDELQCLTTENAHHFISISPDKNCFLDTYSTIDTAPVTLLRKMNGEQICHLETADIGGLQELNWVPAKRFKVTARDGSTPIYGNLYFPSHFDPSKKYPIVDHIYPGPQFYRTSQHFNLYAAIFRSAWTAQALAELGFIVVHVDGFGTPGRSKQFHDAAYGQMGDCGIPDHVAAIQQLASEYHFIDLEKVGVTGYSGGGYAAARAMLMYPEFYKVAVSAAGNHDLRCYPASYGEKYNGLDVDKYESQGNAAYAGKLQGKLLLIHGEMDDNVHPCATMQLVDALIKHNKDFDMLIMPNQNHASTFDHPYYWRKHWDYLVRHLLEQVPPKDYLIKPMSREFPQLMDW